MKSIRFLKYMLWTVLVWLFVNSAFSVAHAAGDVNGKLTFIIEKKTLSKEQAVNAITNRTPILLKVSLRMEGQWYDMLKAGTEISIGSSQFSFATVLDGSDKADYNRDPAAYILSNTMISGTNCTDASGNSLCYRDIYSSGLPKLYISSNANLQWLRGACPHYAYELVFSEGAGMAEKPDLLHENTAGKYYELDLFYLPFILKSPETVYVRGIDNKRYSDADTDKNIDEDGGASTGTTELNLVDGDGSAYTIPCDKTDKDWTSADANCYGGVLPGGIFIEQVPELTQFEPKLPGGQSVFCDGDDITLTATVNYPTGKHRNEYTMELWWKDDYQVGTLTPLVSLNGNSNSASGKCVSGGSDCVGITATGDGTETNTTYTITVPRTLYDVQTPNVGDGETDHLKKFTFVVKETGSSDDPVIRDATAETADLPKIYLNVKEGLTTLTNGLGVARTAASPVDKIEGILAGTQIALRNDCDETHKYVSSKIDYSCYYKDGAQMSSELYFSNVLNGPYYQAANEVGAGQSAFATGYTLASATPLYYYNQLKWNNGCITQTDTVLIAPGTVPPAPSFVIQNYDCGDKQGTMELYAFVPDGVSPSDWQWVIRQEAVGTTGGGQKTPSCLEYADAHDQNPLNRPNDPDAGAGVPEAYRSLFGGGVIFDATHGWTYTVSKSPAPVTYTVSVTQTADKTKSELKVSGGVYAAANWMYSESFIGTWMPAASAELQPKKSGASYNRMTNKWVYARYKVGSMWSEWGAVFTREHKDESVNTPSGVVLSFGTKYNSSPDQAGNVFSIGRKGAGTNDDRPGPKFNAATCDTMIERGQPLQLYFTLNQTLGGKPDKYKLLLEAELLWQVSTDGGTTWTTWATTPANTTVGATDDAPTFEATIDGAARVLNVLPAPSLRYPMQDEKYRILYAADCETSDADKESDNSGILNVTMFSNLQPGKIEATVDGTVHASPLSLCPDAVRLELKNFTAGASLQWEEYDAANDKWNAIAGETNPYLDYSKFTSLADIITNNNAALYVSGEQHKFRVKLELDGETKYAEVYEVTKHYVLPPSRLAVTPDKLTTSGICVGGTGSLTVNFAKPWIIKEKNQWEAALPDQAFNRLAYGGASQASYTYNLVESMTKAMPDKTAFRFVNTNNGCIAYSDTVRMRIVQTPTAAGTLNPAAICPDRDETVEFQSTDGNYFDWAYYSGGAWIDLTAHTRTVTLNIPASAFLGDPGSVDIRVTPYARQTVGSDVTSCPGSVQTLTLTKGDKCDVTLSLADPSQSAFCANDLQDVKINITPNQAKTKTFELQWKQSANDADYASVANDMFTWTENASAEYESLTVKAAFFNGKTVGTKIDFRLVVTEGSVVTNSSAVSVTLKPLPTFGAKTIMMAPASGVCAGTDLTIGTALTPTTGTSDGYTWIYASSAADTLAGARIFHDLPAVDHSASGQALTLKNTVAHRNEMVGRFYGAALTATLNGCTAHDTSYFLAPVIHPLPDTANIVTAVTIGGQNVAELYTCAGKGTVMEVTTNGGKVPTDGSFAYSWTKGGGALPSGVTKTDLAGNAGSKLTFSDAAAITANSGTYTLSLTVTTDKGCSLTLKRDLKIHFETCGKDKVSDGQGTEHTATVPFVLCANDGTWPDVQIEAADLTDGAAGTAKVTKITLYHSAAADMTGETEVTFATPPSNNNPPLKTLKFEVDAAATDAKYKTTGSHYYRGKIERDGYAPTYTDIVEYVIGAVPDRTLTGSVQAWSHADGLSAEIDGPTADLKVCAGLMVNLKLSAAPADGSLTETGGQGGDYKWYRNSSLSASATAPDDPTGLTAVAGSLATTNLGKVASGGANDGLYYAYREYTRSTDIHTGSVSTKTCKALIKVPGGAKVQVKPMPAKPTAIAGETKNLCDGDVFDLTTTTTPATAPDGAAWTYRWYKRAHGESLDKPFNPTDYSQTLPDLTAISVTASGSTGTVTDVYKLKVYLALDGCYDSTLLSGITVNIAPRPSLTKPTVTPSLTGGAVCAGSSLTLTAATTPTPSSATLHYQWFKLKGATADTSADDKVGGDAATYTISSAAATDAGKYYVRVQALSGNCEAKALSDLTTVTVNPLPAPTYVQKIDGVAQTGKTVCKESEPTLLVEASVASGSPAYSYAWQSPASGTGNSYKVPQSATASEGDLTYTVKVKATENGCSSAERTLTFNVKVVDCSNDLIEDGNGKNFEVCAGETAADEWPTVKITANDHAGAGIDKIELYHHTANSTTGGTLIATLTPASGTTAATLEFKPFDKSLVATPSTTLTPSFGSIDFKTPSSTGKHFYYAMVSRSGGTDTKTTAVVEYMVGAMPDKDVVLGTGANTVGILISEKATLVDAKVNGDDNTLTICAGQDAYLHLNNLPSAADLTADNTTLTKYDWYKNNSAHSGAIPDNPAGMGTRFGTAATEKLDVVTGISAQRKDYYYAYLSYEKATKWVTAGKSDKVCAATYAVQTEAVRTVNPMPVMPTAMDAQKIPVCDGATVNLAAKNIDNSPAKPDGTTWTYRWFKDGAAVAPAFGQAPAASDAYSFTAVHGGTPGAANKTIVKNSYTLKVYATAGGCVDSALLNNAVAVEITPAPYADKPVVTSTGTETDADGKPYVCEGKTATLTLQNSPLPNNGIGLSYQWYKVGADGTTRTVLTVGDVYKGVNTATLTVTGKETDQNGVDLAGKYVLVVTVKMSNENCEGEVVSDAFELGFSESPEVRITNGSATDFTLCPDEDTELAVKLDDATTTEIAAGTATVTYQWYKGGKTAAVSGATGATLKVKSTDVGTPSGSDITAQYYVKVTKLKKGYNCPTDVWSDAAVATAGNGGIGKAFTVKVRANCDPEAIVDADAPTVALTPKAAVAICSANVDPGKTFKLKTSDGRLEVSKATWYYAPVTEDASGKLVMGAIKKGNECENIASGEIACPFSTKTDGGMLAAGEWRLWVDVERVGANKATTDTIHFVIRPNPTLANNPKAIMTKAGETTEVPDNLVCQGTSIDLKLDAAAVLNTLTDSKDKTETRTETTTHAWVCTNCGNGVVLATTPVYTYEAPKSKQPVTTAGAPAAARYEGNYTLTEKYVRTYQRTAAPTYNIGCAVWDDAKKDTLKKQFAVNVFTSLTPAGTLADAGNKTAAAYCTADLDDASLQLVFTPKAGTEGTPQAKVTAWEYNVDGGNWQTWATVASGATTPNSLTVDLDDAKLGQPAAGAVKTYQFRAQVANGPCDATIGTYTLSVYGALKAGTLTVPGAVCVGTSNTNISVTASGFEPADATIHFSLYETDPSAGGVSELLGDDVVGKSASASKDFALTTTPTVPTKYFVRYQVKNPQAASPCDELYSDVKEVTVYPSGEISHTGDNGREVCFEDGTEVTFPLTQKNTTGFDVYAFDAPKAEADLKAAVIAGSLTPVANGTATATDVTITYNASASTPAMYQTQTYYYFVAKTGMYAVDKNAACALSIAQTNIKTINPLSAAVLAWDNPQSPSTATDLVIDKGRPNKITLTGGEHQRVDRAEIAATLHYAPDNGSGSPDMSKEQTKDNFISGYSHQFTETGIWHFWVVVDGTPCDDVTSNTIKATVNQSSELLLTGEQDICSDGDIKLEVEVEDDNNTKDVVASSVKWYYGSSDQDSWTELTAGTSANGTVTIASVSPFTMTWTGHGFGQSAATALDFKMTYETTGGSNKATPPYTVTVHPKPALSSLDALNLPAATCEKDAFDIKLADGVTATSASIAGIKWTLQFTQQDPASAQESDWTSKSRDAGGDVLHHALNQTDSGYYRLRIDGNKVCPSVTSNAALLTVNSKPEAGTLSMDPATACFNGDAEIKLTGYKGKITGYEYHPLRDRADKVSMGDTVWRSVLNPSAAFPLNLSGLSDPMPAGGYPDTWTWKNATHGYSLRAIVSNGACTDAVTSMKIQIYDTIKVSKDPVDFPVLVDEDGYPSEAVKFSAAAVTAGLKYVNGTALTPWTAADLSYRWRVSFDKGANWNDLGGAVSGQTTPSVTIEPTYFTAVVKDGSIAAANLGDMRFRCLVTTAKCNHEVRTASAVFTPQTTLHAGTIEPEGTASGCFYYGDTMILVHEDAVGLGTINHHWRINIDGISHKADNFQTLDDAGIKYRYGTKNGAEDRSRIYISTAELSQEKWLGMTIHVFVTDDKHTPDDWFDKTSEEAVESLFAEWIPCLNPKPVWTMKNDTICDEDVSAVFTMEPNADLTGVTITKMVFDVTPVDHTSTTGIVSLDKMTGSCEYVADGSQKLNAVLDNATKRTMTLNRAGDRFHELYDSMVVKAVVGTDCSQKDETVYAILRIDRGVKSLTTQQAELTVCEGGSVDLEAAIERYSSTIPSEIKWKWQRRAILGDASTDKDAGEGNKFKNQTTDGVPDPVKLTLNPVKPTDSGIWVLKTETECGEARELEFKLKVNVKPTWKDDLTVGDDDICAGATALNLAAALHVNWEPEIQWERSKTGADGSWTPLVTDGTMTVKADYDTPGQAKLSLDIVPTYLSDSAYYRIAVKAPAGSACADFALYSATRYVHIDTTPQITLSRKAWALSSGTPSSDLKATVHNPKPAAGSGEPCEQKPAEWRVLYADNLVSGAPYNESVSLSDFKKTTEGQAFVNNITPTEKGDGSGYTLTLTDVPLALDGISVFLVVENCCGVTRSDTVLITVTDALAIGETENDTVCEGTAAHMKATANINIDDPAKRSWEYTTGESDENWKPVPMTDWQATEDMKDKVATLTIPNVPYSMDGYRFRFKVDEGGAKYSDPAGTLVVRPVENLHVLVTANPNPASDAPGFDNMTLEALVYLGDAPSGNTLPENAELLDEEALKRYGYTVFDWYQIAPGKAAQADLKQVNTPGANPFETDATGDALHTAKLTVKNLLYADHDSTHYFAILRSGCFEASEWADQQDPTRFAGLHSDTTTLRIYEDLIVEWTAESMYADTLPYGTTPEDLADMLLPTDVVIGVHLEDRDPDKPEEVKHWISSAYYIKCADLTDAKLAVELRKGVQSEEDATAIATRQWYYRTGPDDEWHLLSVDDGTRFGYAYADDGTEFYIDNTRRTLQVNGVTYDNNGWQFRAKAMADSVGKNEDGSAIYRYRDSTPVLTLVVSEPLPDDLAFLPDERTDASCDAPHDYRIALNAEHESYNYAWEIKTPGAADFEAIDSLAGKTDFAYGQARPEDDGTLVRAIVGNFCGSDTVEAEIRVMSVAISPDSGFCADRTYTLQATPKRAGDNPTYAWFINGVAVSGATAATFTFDPTALPAGVSKAADGIYRVRVMATRDEALTQETDPYQFVNPVACATATLTVYDLPAIDVTADATNLTVIDSTTVRVSGVEEGGTVSWTPADYLYTPDQPESETKPIAESGSHWFTATVTSARGCVASDSVEIVVASSFTYDSTHVLVLVPPALPWLSDGEGGGDVDKPWTLPDTNVNIVVVGDTLQIKTCRNSLVFLTLFTSGGEPTLVYEWDENGLQPLTDAELADMGYAPLPDTMAAFYLDGSLFEFGCTITERDGAGLSVHVQGYVSYYVTEHVALEALPHMRHNRYYENQVVYFTAHPNNFEQYHFYRYDVTADEQTGEQHGDSRHYKTSYDREDGAEQAVYVAVADRYGCRSYDSVNLRVISLPNAMIFNDPNYPEADVIFPEFEVEVHDSWGRMVKSMVDGLGWDGTYAGKQVEGGTYYYRVKLPTLDGFTYIKGAVTVFTKKK